MHSHGARRPRVLIGGNTMVSRQLTRVLGISINSAFAMGSRGNTRHAVGITNVDRVCVNRFVFVGTRYCRRIFNSRCDAGTCVIELGSRDGTGARHRNTGFVGLTTIHNIIRGAARGGVISAVIKSLGRVVRILVLITILLTIIVLCSLAGLGISRHVHRLSAVGILNFRADRAAVCVCHRAVLLSLLNVLTKCNFKR